MGVNLALDNRLARESQFTRKQSVTVHSEHIYHRARGRNTVQDEIPGCTPENVQLGPSQENSINPIDDGVDNPTSEIIRPPSKFISNVKRDVNRWYQ